MNEISNRYAKANRFADLIEARGIVEQITTYNDSEWAELAAQAGERPPSESTRQLIAGTLLDRAKVRAGADPFDFLGRG